MSFLSSHRLHWGVHHELSDNFWLHLEQMVRNPSPSPGSQSDPTVSAQAEEGSTSTSLTPAALMHPESTAP
jgi:hypothetical protein